MLPTTPVPGTVRRRARTRRSPAESCPPAARDIPPCRIRESDTDSPQSVDPPSQQCSEPHVAVGTTSPRPSPTDRPASSSCRQFRIVCGVIVSSVFLPQTGRPAILKASARRLAVTARSAIGRAARASKQAGAPPIVEPVTGSPALGPDQCWDLLHQAARLAGAHPYQRMPPRPCVGHAPAPVFASQTSSTTSAFGRHLSTPRVHKRLGPFPVSRGVGPKDVVVLEVPGRCSG
jgi:hypothetical protein